MHLELGCYWFAECFDSSIESLSETSSVLKGNSHRNSQRRGVDRRAVVFDESQQHPQPWPGKTDFPFHPSLQTFGQTLQNSGKSLIKIPMESVDGDLEGSRYLFLLLPCSNHPCNSFQKLEKLIISRMVLDPDLHGFQPAYAIAGDGRQYSRLKPLVVHMPEGNGTQCFEGPIRGNLSQ